MTYRTDYEVGWNDMAVAINNWKPGCCDKFPNETRIEYVKRCLGIAKACISQRSSGYRDACLLFLSGDVEQLAYKGGFRPQKHEISN